MACKIIYKGISYDESDFKSQIERYVAINNLFNENESLANEAYEALGIDIPNLPIVDTEDITSFEGTKGAAQYDRKNNQIKVNRKLLKQKFSEQAWTKPRKLIEILHGEQIESYAQALPENQFSSYQEWEQFVINHEYQHSLYSRQDFDKEFPNKTKGDYESEINRRALDQITPQQKQQALQLYSQYLDTIFPDSKVKDIVYHGSYDKIDKFDIAYTQFNKMYFANKPEYAKGFRQTKYMYRAMINSSEQYHYFEGNDSIEYVVKNNEDIHILGSKQDIEGFKEFVQGKQTFAEFQQSLNGSNVNPILQNNQQEQVKKFAELQERLNNKEFLEGAKNAFESSEELQNVAFEVLGFKTKTSENEITRGIKEILPFKVIGNYSNIEEGLTGRRQYSTTIDGNNYVFDISTYSYENEDGTFQSYYDIDFTVNGSEDIIGTGFFDKSEKAKQIIQAIISQNYGNDTIRINVEESKKGKQRLLLYKRLMNQLGYNPSDEMEYALFYDIKTDKVNLIPQQKQDALNAYTDYIARVSLGIIKNPSSGEYNYESKAKDIVYHFSNVKIDKPSKEKFSLSANINRRKGFFGINKNINPGNNFANVEGTIPHAMLFDMKNPDFGDFSIIPPVVAKDETKDSAIIKQRGGINYYSVFEPEQIHILSSKADVEGFKEFINKNKKVDSRFSTAQLSDLLKPMYQGLVKLNNGDQLKTQNELLFGPKVTFVKSFTNELGEDVGLYYLNNETNPIFSSMNGNLKNSLKGLKVDYEKNINSTLKINSESEEKAVILSPKIDEFYNNLSKEEQEKLGNIEELYNELFYPLSDEEFIDMLKCKL